MNGSPYLTVEEVADRYRTTVRAIHGRTRLRTIPHMKRTGFRQLLFSSADLDAWDAGAALEVVELLDGSILVRPTVAAGLAA
jgi:hypothetical protein